MTYLLLYGLVGLIFGSFANVLINAFTTDATCVSCSKLTKNNILLPVLGRSKCSKHRSYLQYTIVEVLMGILFIGIGLRFGTAVAATPYLVFCFIALAVSAIDLKRKIVPNKIILPGIVVSSFLFLILSIITHYPQGLVGSILWGMVGTFSIFFIIHLISPKAMGFGDVRMSAFIGMFTGWLGLWYILIALASSFFLGTLVGIVLIAKGQSRKTAIPFAPMLAVGTLISIFFGSYIVHFLVK